MKFGLFSKAVLLASILSFGAVRAESLTDVLADMRTYLSQINKCASVQMGPSEYENTCTPEQSALAQRTINEIKNIETRLEQQKIAEIKTRVSNLSALAQSTSSPDKLRNLLNAIGQCESVQVDRQEYRNMCIPEEQAFIDQVRKKIKEIEADRSSHELARDSHELDTLVARANRLKK